MSTKHGGTHCISNIWKTILIELDAQNIDELQNFCELWIYYCTDKMLEHWTLVLIILSPFCLDIPSNTYLSLNNIFTGQCEHVTVYFCDLLNLTNNK